MSNMKRIISLAFSLIFLCTSIAFAAPNITNAFSPNENEVRKEYQEKYGWEEDKYVVKEWAEVINGKSETFKRLAGYQDYYFYDNIYTTRKYLGLTDGLMQEGVTSKGADKIVSIALSETNKKDSKENPLVENEVKYNHWFFGTDATISNQPWSTTFVSWCADKCGYIESTLFTKTASATSLYSYFVNLKGFIPHLVSNTTSAGGAEYIITGGDIIFFFDEISGGVGGIGIVISANEKGFWVVEGDKENKVSKTFYSKESGNFILNSEVVHIIYPD